MPLSRVWGIGLPRTGTTSLCEAFKILGYTPAVHNPHFEDLPRIRAGSDSGVAAYYRYLFYRHPDSKFILTTRRTEGWLPSMQFLISQARHIDPKHFEMVLLRRSMLFRSMGFDPKGLIDDFHRHHENVRTFFQDKPGKLLELNIIAGDGWEKLCPFLGKPIPDQPFPVKHSLERPKTIN